MKRSKPIRKTETNGNGRKEHLLPLCEGPAKSALGPSERFKAGLLRTDAVATFQLARHSPTCDEIAELSSIIFCGLRFASLPELKGRIGRVLGACENDACSIAAVLGCLDAVKGRALLLDALTQLESCKSKAKMVETADVLR